ncbi:MAG: CBS domain-containing protein [Planctomycetes bacterium]|jgi:CBS domain-containing protein|nr:CBS domain-containing protein [Planctomycetota bacterium]
MHPAIVRARDLANPEIVTIPRHASLLRAAELLEEQDVHGAPVVDTDGSLVGMITRSDIVAYLTDHVDPGLRDSLFETTSFRATEIERALAQRAPGVEDAMTRGIVTIEPSATAGEVASLLLEQGIGRVVVTDAERVRGVISATDLLRVVGRYESALIGTVGPHPADR